MLTKLTILVSEKEISNYFEEVVKKIQILN